MFTSGVGDKSPRIVFIGAGNVASHLAPAIEKAGAGRVVQVWSRAMDSASALASRLGDCEAVIEPGRIVTDADMYVVCMADHAVPALVGKLPHNNALWVHTSGSLPVSILGRLSGRTGVLYPLQTFSRNVDVDMTQVPFFIEGSTPDVTDTLSAIARAISGNVHYADGGLRARMHVAAVFACNFTNHLYSIADGLLRNDGLDLSVLYPLMQETLRKAMERSPRECQTGPAVRGDVSVVEKHASMLPHHLAGIYMMLSRSINRMK